MPQLPFVAAMDLTKKTRRAAEIHTRYLPDERTASIATRASPMNYRP
jgi:hypothetical protein